MKFFLALGVLLSFSQVMFAAVTTDFRCRLDLHDIRKSVIITGSLEDDVMNFRVDDPEEVLDLGIDFTLTEVFSAERDLRKNEDTFRFARYYAEVSGLRDIAISIPKKITGNPFVGYITAYFDDGDRMSPYVEGQMSCILQ